MPPFIPTDCSHFPHAHYSHPFFTSKPSGRAVCLPGNLGLVERMQEYKSSVMYAIQSGTATIGCLEGKLLNADRVIERLTLARDTFTAQQVLCFEGQNCGAGRKTCIKLYNVIRRRTGESEHKENEKGHD